MSIETIGKNIAAMRKEKGIKQEELANHVGVSTQAVSKWENGGVPDTELLPKIADFFGVSVDSLFGRSITDYSDLQTALIKKIVDTPKDQRFKLALDYCWDIEMALFGNEALSNKDSYIADYSEQIGEGKQAYSSIQTNKGFTRMGIGNMLHYFLLVPEIKDTEAAFFKNVDYLTFFKDMSDKDVFNTCLMLYKRENNKWFTANLLVKNLKVDITKASEILDILKKYNLVYTSKIEVDDDIHVAYNFKPTPSFIALLIFAREIIKEPNLFYYYAGNRNKPYLK